MKQTSRFNKDCTSDNRIEIQTYYNEIEQKHLISIYKNTRKVAYLLLSDNELRELSKQLTINLGE